MKITSNGIGNYSLNHIANKPSPAKVSEELSSEEKTFLLIGTRKRKMKSQIIIFTRKPEKCPA